MNLRVPPLKSRGNLSPAHKRRQAAELKALGDRLKKARLQAAIRLGEGVSQAGMAELVGKELGRKLHQTTWSDYEAGETEPPLPVLRAVAAISGVSRDWLTYGDPEPEAMPPFTPA